MKKAIFVDKDGTLINDIPYNVDPQLVSLMRNTTKGLRAMQAAGFDLVIVSNQPGLALGRFHEGELKLAMQKLFDLLAAEDIFPLAAYCCPHAVEGTVTPYARSCECRKPMPGLLLCAAQELGISLADSWMIGDILNDIEAGHRAGCKTILIDNGNETEWVTGPWRKPDHIASDIDEASTYPLRQSR